MNNKFYTVKDLSKILKLNPYTIRKKLNTGEIEGIKTGQNWLVSNENLNDYLGIKNVVQKSDLKRLESKIDVLMNHLQIAA